MSPIDDICLRCRHLHSRTPTELDPWRYRCDVPFVTLTMARESGRCKYFESAIGGDVVE